LHKPAIRKIITVVEEVVREAEVELKTPARKAAGIMVIKNPYCGVYQEDLQVLIDYGEEIAKVLVDRCIRALGVTPDLIESYGKAVMVGERGELEHAAAICHPKLPGVIRSAVDGIAMLPSVTKVGGMGSTLDVPVHYKRAMRVRTHFDHMEIRVPDAPRADEIVIAVVLTDSGRPLARIPGLRKEEAKGIDGQY
jgi:hypothetical protein